MTTPKNSPRRSAPSRSGNDSRPEKRKAPTVDLGAPIPKGPRSGNTRRMMTNIDGQAQKVYHENVCRVLDQCQSCPMLDLDYRDQLVVKTGEFRKKLADAGLKGKHMIAECLPSPERLGYRHSAKLVVSDKFAHPDKRFINIGLYKPGTHFVVDVGDCPVQRDRINKVAHWLRTAIREHNISVYDERSRQGLLRYVTLRTAYRSKDTIVTLVVTADDKLKLRPFARTLKDQLNFVSGVLMHINDSSGNAIFQSAADTESNDVAASGQTTLLAGEDCLRDSLANLQIRISATSFFQINPAVAERAYFRMLEWLSPKPHEHALDLYCGVGSLALMLAKAGCNVTAIEETPSSIADAQENALINSLQHISFHAGRAETLLPHLMENGSLRKVDVMTVNPSRRGCQPEVLKALTDLKPRAVAYMSCNPDTLLRDLRQLENLGYMARAFELYDMFPGSRHYEVVTLLTPE
ncbi:MAG: 23S rRNA (uracil(1939)-C(5))-methyltransferase RlmD [Betaproteobacteria bacterium]|nr:23S rRNA (uracil(1939)-C(5))-methyltransferase RlmD [Betaproteobacteria bacterium]